MQKIKDKKEMEKFYKERLEFLEKHIYERKANDLEKKVLKDTMYNTFYDGPK